MSAEARTVVVTQSNYLPWRGWFDMLRRSDCLVLLDSVQYTRRDWRNRNKIKIATGPSWLTVPVDVSGRYSQAIDETQIHGTGWAQEHLRQIEAGYRRAASFEETYPWLRDMLLAAESEVFLSRANETLIRVLCARLSIDVDIRRDAELAPRADLPSMAPSERLARLVEAVGGTRYISGPAAKAYLDPEPFARRGIAIDWMSYEGYPEYPQLWGDFEPAVSIVDLLLNTGSRAAALIGRREPADAGEKPAI